MDTLSCAKMSVNGLGRFVLSQQRVFHSLQKAEVLIARRLLHSGVGCECRQPRHDSNTFVVRNELHSDAPASHSNDGDYVNSSVLAAAEVKSGSDGFLIRMQDGRHVKCVHNNPDGGRLPDYAPQPAIVLKIEDGSDLLLPIIVLELPAAMLMETLRKVHLARPTIYQVLNNLIEIMGFKVKLVRVTKRVQEAYYAQLILCKEIGEEKQEISLDLRPSDAINIAARCQVPIQVNRQLAYGDGVRIANDPAKVASRTGSSYFHHSSFGMPVITELDRPQADQLSSLEAEEFVLVRSMLMAAAEERYLDAARIRDELNDFRTKKGN